MKAMQLHLPAKTNLSPGCSAASIAQAVLHCSNAFFWTRACNAFTHVCVIWLQCDFTWRHESLPNFLVCACHPLCSGHATLMTAVSRKLLFSDCRLVSFLSRYYPFQDTILFGNHPFQELSFSGSILFRKYLFQEIFLSENIWLFWIFFKKRANKRW